MQYQFLDCRFDEQDGQLRAVNGAQTLTLRPQVARLLAAFLEQPGQVIERDQLYQRVWDEGTVIDFESGLAAVLRELRRALVELGCPGDLIETIPRRGYRLRLSAEDIERGRPAPAAARPAGRRHVAWLVVTATLVLIVGLFWWRTAVPPVVDPAGAPADALAILPFEQFSGHDRPPEHAGLLMADYLLAELWENGLEGVSLIGRTSLRAYAERDDVAAAVAADLGVNLLIEGSIGLTEGGWRVDVRLLEIPPGRIVWSQMLIWPVDQPLPVADSASQIVDQLRTDWAESLNRAP